MRLNLHDPDFDPAIMRAASEEARHYARRGLHVELGRRPIRRHPIPACIINRNARHNMWVVTNGRYGSESREYQKEQLSRRGFFRHAIGAGVIGGFMLPAMFENAYAADKTISGLPQGTRAQQYVGTSFGDTVTANKFSGLGYTNVLDYGADPTGVADSTTAILNAIQAVVTNSPDSDYHGTVIFPPGIYKCSGLQAFTSGGGEFSVRLQGFGLSTKLVSSANTPIMTLGYNNGITASGTRLFVDGFDWNNSGAGTSAGCLKVIGATMLNVTNNRFGVVGGKWGLECWEQVFTGALINNQFTGSGHGSSGKGLLHGQHMAVYTSDFSALGTGYQCYSTDLVSLGFRCEENDNAFNLGVDSAGASSALAGYFMSGGSFESNLNSVSFRGGYGVFGNCSIQAASYTAHQSLNGFVVQGTTPGCLLRGMPIGGSILDGGASMVYTGYAFDGNGLAGATLDGIGAGNTGGTAWNLPSFALPGLIATNCNNPAIEMTIANLPASPFDGERQVITDCHATDAVFMGTPGATGTGAVRRPVQYFGGLSGWRVC